jgi:hypothetical protein
VLQASSEFLLHGSTAKNGNHRREMAMLKR